MGMVLSNKLFKVVIQNTSLELLDLNKIQFNNLYIQITMQNAILELLPLFQSS
jgi:hypothetical protein